MVQLEGYEFMSLTETLGEVEVDRLLAASVSTGQFWRLLRDTVPPVQMLRIRDDIKTRKGRLLPSDAGRITV